MEKTIFSKGTTGVISTIRTTLVYFSSLLKSVLHLKEKSLSLNDIINFQEYSSTLSSSGQPTKEQFWLIRQAGFSTVINLAPYSFIEGSLKNEAKIVTDLGMHYIHIPVNFNFPRHKEFEKFVAAMQDAEGEKIWVHCAVNARASSFIYKYRCTVLGEEKDDAIWDLREIWEPMGPWRTFVFGKKA